MRHVNVIPRFGLSTLQYVLLVVELLLFPTETRNAPLRSGPACHPRNKALSS